MTGKSAVTIYLIGTVCAGAGVGIHFESHALGFMVYGFSLMALAFVLGIIVTSDKEGK